MKHFAKISCIGRKKCSLIEARVWRCIPTLGTQYSQPGNEIFPPWEYKTTPRETASRHERNGFSLQEKRLFAEKNRSLREKNVQ